jgi:hypothetical protein
VLFPFHSEVLQVLPINHYHIQIHRHP